MRRTYQTDLSDAEWAHIEPHLPAPQIDGRPRVHPLREILNAIFYIVRSGCAWRLLPHDLPPWKTVHHYFRTWRLDGTWEKLHATASKETLMKWAGQWLHEGVKVDWEKLLPPRGFQVLPRRWVVERTFSWIGQNRRMSKDYERLAESSEAFIYVAMSRLMVRRLAQL